MNRWGICLVTLCALALCGCAKSGISGAAMMRVEVDVYKGPVGQGVEIQTGELGALLAETMRSTTTLQTQALTLANTLGCNAPKLN